MLKRCYLFIILTFFLEHNIANGCSTERGKQIENLEAQIEDSQKKLYIFLIKGTDKLPLGPQLQIAQDIYQHHELIVTRGNLLNLELFAGNWLKRNRYNPLAFENPSVKAGFEKMWELYESKELPLHKEALQLGEISRNKSLVQYLLSKGLLDYSIGPFLYDQLYLKEKPLLPRKIQITNELSELHAQYLKIFNSIREILSNSS